MIQPLLEATRKASLSAVWSQGVKLARENAVTRASRAPGELTLRVRSPGFAIAPTVTLYVDELEWSCDCGGSTGCDSTVVLDAGVGADHSSVTWDLRRV